MHVYVQAEQRAQFSTFAILTSPLILGNDLRNLSADCLAIIANREIIALNQDQRVSRARLVYQFPLVQWPNADRIPPTGSPTSWQEEGSDATGAPATMTAGITTPVMTTGLAIEWCNKSDPAQQFLARDVTGPQAAAGRPPRVFTLRPVAAPSDCVTYGGFHLANLGIARCEQPAGRSDPCSQQWYAGTNGTLRPAGSDTRCLNVGGCVANSTVDMALCPRACSQASKQQGKCGAECLDGTDSRKVVLVPTGPPGVVAIKGAMGSHTGCVTMVPHRAPSGGGGGESYPGDGPINITVQAWAKSLADGSVGVVVFNRGSTTTSVDVTWSMLGLAAGAVGAVRDLWAHADRGNHVGSYTCAAVAPHDVCALRVTPQSPMMSSDN